MDVYLVPIGHDRHELYCEVPDDPADAHDPDAPDTQTFLGRFKQRIQTTIADAEREWRERQAGRLETPTSRWGRVKARARAWVAEKVAEQRLLWHLRRQDTCALYYAEDSSSDAAILLMRESLQRDFERHRKWFAVNVVGFLASGIAFLVPGPNVFAYYFFFRLAGHYLSMKGARQGLDLVVWEPRPSRALAELRAAAALPVQERAERVRAIAASLQLEHLATFFSRVAAV